VCVCVCVCVCVQASALRKEKQAARVAAEEREAQRQKARDVKDSHSAPQKVGSESGRGVLIVFEGLSLRTAMV